VSQDDVEVSVFYQLQLSKSNLITILESIKIYVCNFHVYIKIKIVSSDLRARVIFFFMCAISMYILK